MSESRIKVLNIAGSGRSGSTILGNVLGQLDGYLHVGELCYVWNRGVVRNVLCGCGAAFRDCDVWSRVFDDPQLNESERLATRLARVPRAAGRWLPLILTAPRTSLKWSRDLAFYVERLGALYQAIQRATGCDVIIDSSKVPLHSFLLSLLDDVDVYFLQLVRDPRAVAYSWQRKQLRSDDQPGRQTLMTRVGVGKSAVKWDVANITMEVCRRRQARVRTMRYEDFVQSPRSAVEQLAVYVGEARDQLPFVSESEVIMGPTHTIWGNPNRLNTGPVRIQLDDQWTHRMRWASRWVVTSLTWPLLSRYPRLHAARADTAGAAASPSDSVALSRAFLHRGG